MKQAWAQPLRRPLDTARWAIHLLVFACLVGWCVAGLSLPAAGSQVPAEPPAPQPSAPVQKILDEEVYPLMQAKGSLKAVGEALGRAQDMAKGANDPAGEARTHQTFALLLEALRHPGKAASAWWAAAGAWERAGYGPGRVEALGSLGRLRLAAGRTTEAESFFREALAIVRRESTRPIAAAEALRGVAQDLQERGNLERAREFLTPALEILEKLVPQSMELAAALADLGNVVAGQGDLAAARAYYSRALALQEKAAPDSLAMAKTLNNLGNVAAEGRDLAAARAYYSRALALQEKAAPDSLAMAASWNNLGHLASEENDLPAAMSYHRRALARRERLAPNSLAVASSLIHLGTVAHAQKDWAAAKDYYQRALALQEKLALDAKDVGVTLHALGGVAYAQGDWAAAEEYYRRALALQEKAVPDSDDMAHTLHNLGQVAVKQGNLVAAWGYFQRALEMFAPDSLAMAENLNSLGAVAHDRGDLTAAKDYHQRALALREKLDPDSLAVAGSLHWLGLTVGAQGDLPAAREHFQRALAMHEMRPMNPRGMAWTLNRLGSVVHRQGDLAAARGHHQRALALQEKLALDPEDIRVTLNELGGVAYAQGDWAAAEEYYRRALALQGKAVPDPDDTAHTLHNLGQVAVKQGNLVAAEEYFQRALEMHAPDSLAMAEDLSSLGAVAHDRGDLTAAKDYHQRALALREKLDPDSLAVAGSLYELGLVTQVQGHLRVALAYHQRALEIKQQLVPNSLDVALSLTGVGAVLFDLGDLEAARQQHRQALALREKLAPGSMEVAGSLMELGMVAFIQHDLVAAKDYHRRALAIKQERAPNSLSYAKSFLQMASVALAEGDVAAGRDYTLAALKIFERIAPKALEVAQALITLAQLAAGEGHRSQAREYLEQALGMVPDNSLSEAVALFTLALVLREEGELAAAKSYLLRAMHIMRPQSPASNLMVAVLVMLGEIALQEGQSGPAAESPDALDRVTITEGQDTKAEKAAILARLGMVTTTKEAGSKAEELVKEAWRLVRQQGAVVTGDDALQAFGAFAERAAAILTHLQLALGKLDEAFLTMEEGRGQALLRLLVDRRLDGAGAPAELRTAYRLAVAARDRAEAAISRASVAASQTRRALVNARWEGAASDVLARAQGALDSATQQLVGAQVAYTSARVEAEQRWADIKKSIPRADPTPLSLDQARQVLPADMLFMAFSVDKASTSVFLLRPASSQDPVLLVYTVPVTAKALRVLVQTLRLYLTNPQADAAKAVAASRALFAQLFPEAARNALAGAQRLLIAPDGPLWELPYAALVINVQGPPQYLGAAKAITSTPSLTLFAQARTDAPPLAQGGQPWAVVVGHPLFDRQPARLASTEAPGSERRALFSADEPPPPLPATKWEVAAVAALYGVDPLTEERATEAALRAQMEGADVIHLATHGYWHPIRAMSSGVLLTPPAREPASGETADDGVLQAWEIYSQLTLRAELVVLSACETGRGHRVQSEGIIGLTRALQYAGARSIVASQWQVADASTATLMVAFHRSLRQGFAKDEALRQAMAVVRQDPATAHPYYWAPFFLVGDPDNPTLGAGALVEEPGVPLGIR